MESIIEENMMLKGEIKQLKMQNDDLLGQVHALKKKLADYKLKFEEKEREWRKVNKAIKSNTHNQCGGEELKVAAKSVGTIHNEPTKNVLKVVDHKYEEVIRGKDKREKLRGFACRECEAYYKRDNLSNKELNKKLKHCSKHRAQHSPPPQTQPSFWNVRFPSTQTCKDKGYLLCEDDEPPEYVTNYMEKQKKKKGKYF